MTHTISVGSVKQPRNIHFIDKPIFNEIEEMRHIHCVFLDNDDVTLTMRIKDMSISHIKHTLKRIMIGELQETEEYSLPYLQYVLEAELKIRPILNSYITEKIFNSLPQSRATKDINRVIKPSKTTFYQKRIFYS